MFVGLEPLLDKVRLPKLLRSNLALQGAGADPWLPCYIVASRITKEFTIPQEPTEAGQMVSDTIIQAPLHISLDLFIYEDQAQSFFEKLNSTQASREGFVFTDRKDVVYRDLFMVSYAYEENSDQLGSFDLHLELQQILRVVSVATVVAKQQIPAAAPVNKGTTTATKVESTELKSTAYELKQKAGGVVQMGKQLGKSFFGGGF